MRKNPQFKENCIKKNCHSYFIAYFMMTYNCFMVIKKPKETRYTFFILCHKIQQSVHNKIIIIKKKNSFNGAKNVYI